MAGENEEVTTYTQEQFDAKIAEITAGLKKNRDEALKEAKQAKERLSGYDGVDPEEFKRLKAESEEAQRKKATAEGDFKALEKQLIERHQVEKQGYEGKIGKLQSALEKRLVDAQLAEAIAKAGAKPAFVPLLKLEGRQFVRVKETDADFESFVVDDQGNARVADGQGTPMNIDMLVEQTLKTKYPEAFMGSGSSGGGATRSSGGAASSQTIAVGSRISMKDIEALAKPGAVAVTQE